jgi:Ca2+-binding RTX toxin-like protein
MIRHWHNRIGKIKSQVARSDINRAVLFVLEPLERRAMLTGGTWTALTHTIPSEQASTMLLLSDGSVMVQGGQESEVWYKLVADSSGSYVNGTFTRLHDSNVAREYFASDVLRDGRVFVAGGEDTPDGDPNTGEIYDPVADGWTAIDRFPNGASLADGMSEVLSDGKILVQDKASADTYLCDPATGTWTKNATLLHGDYNDEESWVKLPDGSLLDYEVNGIRHGQRWVAGATHADDQWVDAGEGPGSLTDSLHEIGPGVMLDNGHAMFFGANGSTGLYDPATDSWTAGPEIRDLNGNLHGMDDGPGAVMFNGKVLFEADYPTGTYNGTTAFFEYDRSTNHITQITAPQLSVTTPSFAARMLDLPNGQVLYANQQDQLWVYTPDGSPLASGKPTVSSVINNGTNFTLSGTQLNGISEGAYYGDDAQMASNYPIVRLTFPGTSGTVAFGRTFNWSSTGVQTGTTPVTTQFVDSVNPGPYLLAVIANGIASDNALFVQMGTGANNVTVRVDPSDSTKVQVLQNGSTLLGSFSTTGSNMFTKIIVTGDSTNSALTVDTSNGNPIPSGGLNFDGAAGTNTLHVIGRDSVNDSAAITGSTFSLNGSSVTYSNVQAIQFDGGAGNDSVSTSGVSIPLTLNGGDGNDAFNGGTGADSLNGGSGNDTIAGDSGSDTLIGGAGTDTVDYSASSVSVNGGVNGTAHQGSDTDTLSEFENVNGSSADDTLVGDDGANNVINGEGGNDRILGNPGNDTIDGGAGNDYIEGNGGNDSILGGDGNDTISGDSGNDGSDPYSDTIDGGAGNDVINGDEGDDSLRGGAGNDTIYGYFGNDMIDGGTGSDSMIGGSGTDLADYSASSTSVNGGVNGTAHQGADTDVLSGFENVNGSSADDTLVGDDGPNNVINGEAGNDYILGNPGNDTIDGGAGNDFILGNYGSDSILGGDGSDTISGDDGSDGSDPFSDTIDGGAGNDVIDGDEGDDSLRGGAGNDTIYGYLGNDTIDGGAGNDSLVGDAGNDVFLAADGEQDTLVGGSGTNDYSNKDLFDVVI